MKKELMSLKPNILSYPRVSDIIGKQRIEEMQAIPIEMLVNAAERGVRVHQYCASYMKSLWIPEIDDDCIPYFKAFQEWYQDNAEKVILTDTRLYDHEKVFTGEFDLIVNTKQSASTVLIDIKTSHKTSKAWPIQLAAYQHLCHVNGIPVDESAILHLKKNKSGEVKAELLPFTDLTRYWKVFESALDCYDYFHRKEPK